MKYNNIFNKCLFVSLLALLMPVVAWADEWIDSETNIIYEYDPNGTEASVTSSPSVQGNITILPSITVGGKSYQVKTIRNSAFWNCSKLISVNIPEGVTTLEACAFFRCFSLTTVNIPQSVETIGNAAFSNCSSLVSISFPNKLKNVGSEMFYSCESLISFVIPEGVETIEEEAFAYCHKLQKISFPSTLKRIEQYAFNDCGKLESILLPTGLEYIGQYSFILCTSLTSVDIPEGVTEISAGAFSWCTNLNHVSLPASLKTIGSGALAVDLNTIYSASTEPFAFSDDAFTSNTYEWGMLFVPVGKKDAYKAADGWNKFKNIIEHGDGHIYYPTSSYKLSEKGDTLISWTGHEVEINMSADPAFDNVIVIGWNAFDTTYDASGNLISNRCQKLILPNKVEVLERFSLSMMIYLSELVLPESLKRIEWGAIGGAGICSINIPSSLEYIEETAFDDCHNLKEFVVSEANPYFSEENGVLFNKDKSKLLFCGGGKEGVYFIPDYVKELQEYAFGHCNRITSIYVPNSVTVIPEECFFNMHSLESVNLPSTLKTIEGGAFEHCSKLTEIRVHASLPPEMKELNGYTWSPFYPVSDNAVLYVPEGSIELYAEAKHWNEFKNILPLEDDCNLSDLPTDNAYYGATAFLCERGVLSGSKVDGKTDVEGSLKRAHLAKIAFRGLYLLDGGQVPATVPSDNFPTVYSDLSERTEDNDYYYQAARALMYLEYGDGVAPFDRDRLNFNPDGTISRLHTLKALMEAFDIKPDVTGTGNPFPADAACTALMTANPQKFGYVRHAAQLGIITTQNALFRPNDDCLRGEAFVMLARIMQKIEAGEIDAPTVDDKAYFEPLNTTLSTISGGIGMAMGNFSNYQKSSFVLNGVAPLSFSHSYNSYNTTLPEVFYGARVVDGVEETYHPMGAGWSHNYHTFITQVEGCAIVHWGGGNIDVYRSNGTKYVAESMGVYDDFDINSSGEVTITTKGGKVYRFNNQGGTGAMVLYLTSITDRNGNTTTLTYTNGQHGTRLLSSVSDGHRQLTFSYLQGTNLLSSVKDPLGREVKFSYTYNQPTDEYQLTQFTDAKGQTTTYTYGDDTQRSTAHLLMRIQMPRGNYVENQYDQNRRLTQTVNGAGGVPQAKTSLSVTANYGGEAVSTQSEVEVETGGAQTAYSYVYNASNMLTQMSGADGLLCTLSYDNQQQPHLATAVNTNMGSIDNVTFDDRGNLTGFSVSAGGGSYSKQMTYDGQNRLTSVTDARGYTTRYTYDSRGNLTGIEAPEGVSVSMAVDGRGLTTSRTNAMGQRTQYSYNEYGNLTETNETALGLTTKTTYDAASRVVSTEDAMGHTHTYTYDANDNMTAENDAMNQQTKYGYDANDNLTSITNAKGGVTSMGYDATTDLLTSLSFAGATKRYEYFSDGLLEALTKPDGTRLAYSYDALGRLTSDGVNTYGYDSRMRLTQMTGGSITMTFNYDDMGRIWQVEHAENGNGYVVSYDFDAGGNVTRLHYPASVDYVSDVNYSYDGLNRLTAVTGFGGSVGYTYRKDSQIEAISYGNGMTTTFGYDACGRLTEKKTTLRDGTVVAAYQLTLDKAGNIVSQQTTEPISGMGLANHSVDYRYNDGNRITMAGDTSFGFDANGNTTSRGAEQYTWDNRDRMASLNGTRLRFDPKGNIAAYGDTRYMVDISGNGNILHDSQTGCAYVYGAGLVARLSSDGALGYYVTDMRGSVVAIVDANGNITHRYHYDEFGNIDQMEEQDHNPFRYVGQWGVMYLNDHCYYMRARMYDPTIGRFYSEDPIWSTNLYPYADNNPIMGIDPTGNITQSEYNQRYDVIQRKIAIYTAKKDAAAGDMALANHMRNYKMYEDAHKRRDDAWSGINYWEQKMAELKKSMDTDITGLGIRHDDVQAPQVDQEYMDLLLGRGGLAITKEQADNGQYGLNLNSIQGINKLGDCELAIAEFLENYVLDPYTKVIFKATEGTDRCITATMNGVKYVWYAAKNTWYALTK